METLINTDISARGVINHLKSASDSIGQSLLDTSKAFVDAIKLGRPILILTGAQLRPNLDPTLGETDGPYGAVALARFIQGLGALPIIMVDRPHVETMNGLIREVGLTPLPSNKAMEAYKAKYPPSIGVDSCIPIDDNEAVRISKEFINEINPGAVLAVERVGPNENGCYHNTTGRNVDLGRSRLHHLVDVSRERGILTIGIGDGGNEIGMGLIKHMIEDVLPYGITCRCPCKGSTFTITETDKLITASVSNWGAYGLIACSTMLTGNLELLHTASLERGLHILGRQSNLIDGMSGKAETFTDGISLAAQEAISTLLCEIVSCFIKEEAKSYYLRPKD